MTLVEKLSDVRDFRKILETTVKEIGENYSADVCQIVLSNPLDGNFTSICEYVSNPEEVPDDLASTTFPVQPEGGGLGWLSVSRQHSLSREEIDEIRIVLANIADILRYAQINDIVQRDTFRSAFMSEITNLMSLPMGLGDALFMVVNILGKALAVSRCIFVCIDDNHSEWRSYEYWQRERIEAAQDYGWPTKDSAAVAQTLLSNVPVTAFEGQANSYKTPVQEEMEFIGVRSQLSVALRSSIGVHGSIILQQCESRHAWTRDEIDMVQNVADTVAEALAQLDEEKKSAEPIMRLHQHEVADTKAEGQQSIQEVRKALKSAMGTTTIKKAQKSKSPAPPPQEKAPPPAPPAPAPAPAPAPVPSAAAALNFAPQVEEGFPTGPEDAGPYAAAAAAAEYDPATELGATADHFSPSDIWSGQDSGIDAPPEPNWGEFDETPEPGWEQPAEAGAPETGAELSGLANMLEQQATQAEPEGPFKGVLGGLLNNQRSTGSTAGAWDIQTTAEQPPQPAAPPAPPVAPAAANAEIFPPAPSPGGPVLRPGTGAQGRQQSKWGDLDSIPTPGASGGHKATTPDPGIERPVGGMVPGAKPAAGNWGDLDSIGSPAQPAAPEPPPAPPPVPPQPKAASKWGNLDAIPSPGAPAARPAAEEPPPGEWSELEAIPTPASAKSGLGAMMMGKAKASAVSSNSGLGGSFHKGGVKPPAPPSFVDGPPIQMDEAAEAAAEAKLKQILASSNPTSDYIFAIPGIDMRLLGRIDGWVAQIEAKDKYVNGHCRAVAEYATAVAKAFGMSADEVNMVRLAAIIHDVGKLGLPKLILQKPDEQLSDAELVMTMNHTIDGAKLIEEFPELAPLAPIILAHHEEYDGNGYPEGLAGDQIPLASRIIHGCNAYTEMVSDLVYRQGIPPEQAQNNMIRGAGTTYDPDVVQALVGSIQQGIVPPIIQ